MLIRTPGEIKEFLKRHQKQFSFPQAYFGDEANTFGPHGECAFFKDWDKSGLKSLIVATSRYQDFRGNQTLPLLYYMVNSSSKDVLAERAFVPESKIEYRLFRDFKIPMFGVESKHSAGEFDLIMTSVSYTPMWVNFILQLKMSGIPPLWSERREQGDVFPLTMAGGSMCYGNFGLVFPVVDVIFLGDAEDEEDGGLITVLDYFEEWKKLREGEDWRPLKEELLRDLSKTFDFLFCPRFYTPVYDKEKFIKWEVDGDFPPRRRRICKDLDKATYYKMPIPSYTDTTMGLGEVEIARGCRSMCMFCGIGWKYRPYRERSKDVMVKALSENKRYGGACSMAPIATEFAWYSQKRGLIKELCENHSRYVDPLSMRVDAFASDEDFDRLLSNTGMNQLALGVEAPSQRLRNRMGKGISEDDILKACEIAIRTGKFRKIKFFMISNIGETEEDFEEFFTMLHKVLMIKNFYKSNIRMKASWTPLIVEAAVPIQWMRPAIDIRRTKWKDISDRLRGMGIDFALGIKNNENFMWGQQALSLADTRLATAAVKTMEEIDIPCFSMLPSNFKSVLTKWMKVYESDWSHILREKDVDEPFLWDIVDRGVSKETLKKLWLQCKKGELDNKLVRFKEFMTGLPSEDRKVDLGNVVFSTEQEVSQTYLVEFLIDKEFQCVPNTYWKAAIHRAAYLSDFPIAVNQIAFLSDREGRNWYYGLDCIRFGVRKTGVSFNRMNRYLRGIQIVRWVPVSNAFGMWKDFVGCYDIHTDYSELKLKQFITAFEKKKDCLIRFKSTRYFSGEWRQRADVRKSFVKAEVVKEGGELLLRCYILEDIGIRFFLLGMFSIGDRYNTKTLLEWDIEKRGEFVKGSGGLLSAFRDD